MGWGHGRYISQELINKVVAAVNGLSPEHPAGVPARKVAEVLGVPPVEASRVLGRIYIMPNSPIDRTMPAGHNTCFYWVKV